MDKNPDRCTRALPFRPLSAPFDLLGLGLARSKSLGNFLLRRDLKFLFVGGGECNVALRILKVA